MRKLVLLVSVVAGLLFLAPSAQAAIPSVFGGAVTCAANPTDQVRECGTGDSDDVGAGTRSTAPSWDGTPIDVNVALPPASGIPTRPRACAGSRAAAMPSSP